ncbi:PEGA domain-containing protein [Pontiellaceae bacterium B12227]|nr:PEGA domain-containing protein [Pontiellaceae bacterium B12227]
MHSRLVKGLVRGLMLAAIGLGFGCSTFTLTSAPAADIYENDEKIGRTPYSFNLMSGERTLQLRRYGYVEEQVVVSSLDKKRLHFDLQWIGKTRLDSQPPGAKVVRIADGKELGTTPCSLYLASPDRVVLSLRGFHSVERDLTPNRSYKVELKSKSGFKSTFYKDIMFTSEQGSVQIYDRVAGERIGITPARLNVEAGAALEYRLPGYKSEFDLISRNAPHRIQIKLQPVTRVTLTGPQGAEVYRAGGIEKLGTIPYVVEVEGSAMFEIKKEGFYDRSVAVAASSPQRLQVELKEIPYKTIQTDPPGGDVYRLGGLEKLGTAPFKTIVEGERVFEIKKKGYESSVVGMGPSSPKSLNVPLSPVQRDDPDAAAIGTLDSESIESF